MCCRFTYRLLIVFLFISTIMSAAVPAGYYYQANGKMKAELKTALRNISSPLYVLAYGGSGAGYTWQGFYYTDRRSDSTVVDMYSSVVRKQPDFSAVNGMHIEHSLPKSWWGGHENTAYRDLFHLYPADGTTNTTKSNLPLGEVTGTPSFNNGVSKIGKNGYGTVYSDYCFEPADEYKGDFARSYLYVSTVYEDYAPLWQSPMMNNNSYPVWKSWARDLLLKWHNADPVSQKEIDRNEAVYAIQGNRNPFIDYPALVNYIWGADTTKVFPFPAETSAFLTSPRRGAKIDFGTIMIHDQQVKVLDIKAVNVSSDLTLTTKTHAVQLSVSTVSAGEAAAGIPVSVVFNPATSGIIRDTILISGAGINSLIPVAANATPDFMVLEPTDIHATGGRLRWISDPLATNYRLKVYQTTDRAGDLIFSSYVEGSSWNKAIEIFNGTGQAVNLANYSLKKQSNGAGSFGSELKLSGMLANNTGYTIVHKNATLPSLIAKANLLTDTLLQVNGNDAIALYRNGINVDMIGEADAGASVIWGLDVSLQRKSSVTHPSVKYNNAEWNVLPQDSVAFLGNHKMTLSTVSPSYLLNTLTGNVNFYDIENLIPESKYFYTVDAMRSGTIASAYNSMQLTTVALEVPELLPADNINSSGFTAKWVEVPYAASYNVEVLDVVSTGVATDTNGFDNVGSGGTPLPTGWTSSSISTYTSTASSGVATPSLQLNDNGDWLMTREYEYPVTDFSFMYRFASTGTGSYLTLEAQQGSSWVPVMTYNYVNTTKNNISLSFDPGLNYKKFRFTYTKASGNMAIDDVVVTYGQTDTTTIAQANVTGSTSFNVTGLLANSIYYYRVRSVLSGVYSSFSEAMSVTTSNATSVGVVKGVYVPVYKLGNNIIVKNDGSVRSVSVLDMNGRVVLQKESKSDISFGLSQRGVYIVRIETDLQTVFRKISY